MVVVDCWLLVVPVVVAVAVAVVAAAAGFVSAVIVANVIYC